MLEPFLASRTSLTRLFYRYVVQGGEIWIDAQAVAGRGTLSENSLESDLWVPSEHENGVLQP